MQVKNRPELEDCPICQGRGKSMSDKPDRTGCLYMAICPACQGTGKAKKWDRPDREKIQEDMAQEFYGVYMSDPRNNHLENKEWLLLVEARTKAKEILALFPDIEGAERRGYFKGYQHRAEVHTEIINYEAVEQAKQEERERIETKAMNWIDKKILNLSMNHQYKDILRQALKGEK